VRRYSREGAFLKHTKGFSDGLGNTGSSGTSSNGAEDLQDTLQVYRTLYEDKNAFRMIVEKYTPLFYSLIVKMTSEHDRERVEEYLQEIFVKLFGELERFDRSRRFFPWAYTIAVNFLRSERRRKRRDERQQDAVYNDEVKVPPDAPQYPDPLGELIRSEAESLVLEALEQLRQEYREVFVLRIMEGLSVADTSRVLGIPEGTVKTNLFRARGEIRAYLRSRSWEL
jgi:RNA polymerase sigma factor (sigma-70 family)